VYRVWRDERYSPRGKYHLLDPEAVSRVEAEFLDDLLWACLQCGACHVECPSQAHVDELIRSFRESGGAPRYLREALDFIKDPKWQGHIVLKRIKGLSSSIGLLSRLVKLTPWGMPRFPRTSFLDGLKSAYGPGAAGEISLFAGCVQNHVFPQIPNKAMELSAESFFVPLEQTCCGLPAWTSGLMDSAREFAWINLKSLFRDDTRHILTLCSSCAYTIREVWPRLFDPGTDQWELARRAADVLLDMDEYIHDIGGGLISKTDKKKALLHLPCHVRYAKHRGPSDKGYPGCVIVGVINACCGHGGSFSNRYSEVSREIFKEAVSMAGDIDFDVVLTNCSGCLMQWSMALEQSNPWEDRGRRVGVLHPVELLH